MATPPHLVGLDAAWLAVDAIGQVAIFTTGGEGPVPTSAFDSAERSEELVQSLPMVSGFDLLTSVVRPDDFVAFADG